MRKKTIVAILATIIISQNVNATHSGARTPEDWLERAKQVENDSPELAEKYRKYAAKLAAKKSRPSTSQATADVEPDEGFCELTKKLKEKKQRENDKASQNLKSVLNTAMDVCANFFKGRN